jgi:hypothetical protein
MKWYSNVKFWVVILALVGIASAVTLAVLDKVTGQQALAFIGTGVFGSVLGFLAGRAGGKAVLVLLVAGGLALGGCATTAGSGKFDTCRAVAIAKTSHDSAEGISGVVCHMLTGEKRTQCLKHRKTSATAAKAVLDQASTLAKACGL